MKTIAVAQGGFYHFDYDTKTIQKAVESFRITDEQKALLKTLRVK